MLTRRAVLGAAGAAVLLAGTTSFAKATQTIVIGGGEEGSVHTQAARQICTLLEERAGDAYGCIPRAAPGSAFNIRAIDIGLMEFGLVQSERVREAVAGSGAWQGEPAAALQAVFSLHPEGVLLVTGADVSDDLVYTVVRSVFENFDAFGSAHPALRDLDSTEMLQGLSAPLHPGAARYYRERDWIQK